MLFNLFNKIKKVFLLIPVELIYNLSLLISLSLLSGFLDKYSDRDKITGKILQGLLFGFASVLGMMYPLVLFEGIIFDGRSILLSLCGLFFGPITAVIAGIMALAYRISLGGTGWIMGALVIIEAVAVGLIFYYLRKKSGRNLRFYDFVIVGVIVHIIMLGMMLGLPDLYRMQTLTTLALSILTIFPLATIAIGGIMLDHEKNWLLIKEVKDSEAKLRAYFQSAPDAIFVVDSQGKYIDANLAGTVITGYSKEEILSKTVLDFIPPEDREWAKSHFGKVITQGISYGESRFVRKDGTIGWWTVDAVKIDENNFIGFSKDISEQRKSLEELENSEAKFRELIEKLPDGFYRSTPQGKFTFVNTAFVNMLGYESAEELMSVDIENDLYFSSSERNFANYASEDFAGKYEIYRLKRKDGKAIWIEDHSSYEYDADGKIIQNEGICRDITQRLESESATQELISRMKKVSAHLPGFIYQFALSPDGKLTFPYASDAIKEIYGLTPEEARENTDQVLKAIHPEDIDEVMNSIAESGKNLTIWRKEYRVINEKGDLLWLEGYSSPEKLDDGTILWHGYISVINSRKKTEEEILEREFSLRFAQEIANMGSWEYNLQTRKLIWSENYFKLFGYEPFSFEPDSLFFMQRVHPEDYKFVKNQISNYYLDSKSNEFEFRIIMPDGKIKWIQNTYIPLYRDGKLYQIKGINIDITSRKISEIDLRKLSRAIEQSPLAIVMTDIDGNIEYVNPKFTEMTGFSEEEAIGNNPKILKSGKMSESYYKNMWLTLSSGSEYKGEIINKKNNGELYWESVVIAPVIDEKGAILNYVAMKEDITEKKLMQEELIRAKEKAEDSDRLKSAFLANMSHEIRTPMNGIIGFSRMLAFPDLTEEERIEYSQVLNTSCDRLLNTVNDILDISKIEANQLEVHKAEFDIKKLIDELSNVYYQLFTSKDLNFVLDLELLPEVFILRSDEQRIYQILNNLLSNAYKFTKFGEVTFGCYIKDKNLEFFVKDTGIGISEKSLSFVFGRFNQENIELNRGYEGTGLGLAICKGLADLLGGDILVESKQGEGSLFTLIIPIE